MTERSLDTLQKTDFDPFVGQRFTFSTDHPNWSTEFELFECEFSKNATRTRKSVRDPFALEVTLKVLEQDFLDTVGDRPGDPARIGR